jgi:hypothetical protein
MVPATARAYVRDSAYTCRYIRRANTVRHSQTHLVGLERSVGSIEAFGDVVMVVRLSGDVVIRLELPIGPADHTQTQNTFRCVVAFIGMWYLCKASSARLVM